MDEYKIVPEEPNPLIEELRRITLSDDPLRELERGDLGLLTAQERQLVEAIENANPTEEELAQIDPSRAARIADNVKRTFELKRQRRN